MSLDNVQCFKPRALRYEYVFFFSNNGGNYEKVDRRNDDFSYMRHAAGGSDDDDIARPGSGTTVRRGSPSGSHLYPHDPTEDGECASQCRLATVCCAGWLPGLCQLLCGVGSWIRHDGVVCKECRSECPSFFPDICVRTDQRRQGQGVLRRRCYELSHQAGCRHTG